MGERRCHGAQRGAHRRPGRAVRPRPGRRVAVYSVTDLGRETLEAWPADLLATPDERDPAAYHAGLSLIPYLDPADAADALRRRADALDLEFAGSRARMEGMRPLLPRLFMLEEEQRLSAIEAERAFTEGLVGELASGALTWDRAEFRRMADTGAEDMDVLRAMRAAAAAQSDAG